MVVDFGWCGAWTDVGICHRLPLWKVRRILESEDAMTILYIVLALFLGYVVGIRVGKEIGWCDCLRYYMLEGPKKEAK
jgi:hypothetical protein